MKSEKLTRRSLLGASLLGVAGIPVVVESAFAQAAATPLNPAEAGQRVAGPPYGISYTQWQLFDAYSIVICAPHVPLVVHEVNHRYLDNLEAIEGVKLAREQIAESSPFFPALAHLKAMLTQMTDVLASQAERAETIEQCRVRAVELGARLAAWAPSDDPEQRAVKVLWVDAFSQSLQLHQTPLSIAPVFSKQREGPPRAWIFTSATLAVKNDFTHYSEQLGLTGEPAMSWPSPFD